MNQITFLFMNMFLEGPDESYEVTRDAWEQTDDFELRKVVGNVPMAPVVKALVLRR